MKSELPKVERLTDNEKLVIQWAFNMAHSIVAGEYKLPKPMIYAMNYLQDAVVELAKERHISIKDGCSNEYLGFHKGYWDGVKERLEKETL